MAACGGDDGVRHLDAAVGDAPDPDGALDAAVAVTNEGFASAYYHATNGNTPHDVEGYFHAWSPGIAVPADTFGAYYPALGTAMPLAIGDCAAVAQPPFTNFTSLVAGNQLKLTNGTTMLTMIGPATEGYYTASDTGAPETFVGPALSITAGAGSEAVGGPGTLQLGTIAAITVASEPIACVRSTACTTGATLETSDLAFVIVANANVCRVDPATITIPTGAFTNRPDGTTTVRVVSVRRSTRRLGGGSYEVFLVNDRAITLDLST